MRGIMTLGLVCFVTTSSSLADEAALPDSGLSGGYVWTTGAKVNTVSWQTGGPARRHDRLNYLNGSVCLETQGCSAAISNRGNQARKFVKALNIGSYGPMNVKFTGNRVKLKVQF